MRLKLRITSLAMLLLLSTACAPRNGFKEFYEPVSLDSSLKSIEFCAQPKLGDLPLHDSMDSVSNAAYKDGYYVIGTSFWEGPHTEGREDALKQGKDVQACLVLWRADYLSTRIGTTGIPQVGASVSAFTPGTGGMIYVPYAVDRYSYQAVFLAKVKLQPNEIGVILGTPPVAFMQARDSRLGGIVKSVMDASPAYKENIFVGDIITKINGKDLDLDRDNSYPFKLNSENEIIIYRNGKEVVKKIYLPYNK